MVCAIFLFVISKTARNKKKKKRKFRIFLMTMNERGREIQFRRIKWPYIPISSMIVNVSLAFFSFFPHRYRDTIRSSAGTSFGGAYFRRTSRKSSGALMQPRTRLRGLSDWPIRAEGDVEHDTIECEIQREARKRGGYRWTNNFPPIMRYIIVTFINSRGQTLYEL